MFLESSYRHHDRLHAKQKSAWLFTFGSPWNCFVQLFPSWTALQPFKFKAIRFSLVQFWPSADPSGFQVFHFFFFSFKPSVRRLIQCFNTFMSQNPKFSASHGSAIFPDFFYVTSFPTAFLHYVGGRASLVESTKKTDGFSFIRQHRPYTKDKCNSL